MGAGSYRHTSHGSSHSIVCTRLMSRMKMFCSMLVSADLHLHSAVGLQVFHEVRCRHREVLSQYREVLS